MSNFVLTTLPDALQLFNNSYNLMLDFNNDHTEIFKTAVSLRNSTAVQCYNCYETILTNLKDGSLEGKMAAYDL
jgi:hypothetical protein